MQSNADNMDVDSLSALETNELKACGLESYLPKERWNTKARHQILQKFRSDELPLNLNANLLLACCLSCAYAADLRPDL